jgi:plastocyanin
MRHTMLLLLLGGMLATSLVVGCGDDNASTPTSPGSPSTPPPSTPPPSTPPPTSAPATAAVTVGDIFFTSGHNGSSNPAVDTVAANGTVTWTWATTENLPHSVQSIGSPSFTSSAIQTGAGNTYQFTFTAPGTYQYDCAVHGQMMTGTIVVLAAATSSDSTMAPPPATPPPSTPPPSTPPPSTPPPTGY